MCMQNFSQKNDSVSLCYKSSCIHANGSNANLIAIGAFTMLILFGIASLSRTR